MADVFDGLDKLNKGGFVSIPRYTNSKGEVSSYLINGNISYQTVKENDHKKLMECTEETLQTVATEKTISIDIVKQALTELQKASEKNLSEKLEDRTAQSQAQADVYINLGKGLKLNKTTQKFHIDGLIVKKEVITPIVYPTVNSRPKTIAKNAITKALGLQASKYRTFIIGQSEYINMSGMTCETN